MFLIGIIVTTTKIRLCTTRRLCKDVMSTPEVNARDTKTVYVTTDSVLDNLPNVDLFCMSNHKHDHQLKKVHGIIVQQIPNRPVQKSQNSYILFEMYRGIDRVNMMRV